MRRNGHKKVFARTSKDSVENSENWRNLLLHLLRLGCSWFVLALKPFIGLYNWASDYDGFFIPIKSIPFLMQLACIAYPAISYFIVLVLGFAFPPLQITLYCLWCGQWFVLATLVYAMAYLRTA